MGNYARQGCLAVLPKRQGSELSASAETEQQREPARTLEGGSRENDVKSDDYPYPVNMATLVYRCHADGSRSLAGFGHHEQKSRRKNHSLSMREMPHRHHRDLCRRLVGALYLPPHLCPSVHHHPSPQPPQALISLNQGPPPRRVLFRPDVSRQGAHLLGTRARRCRSRQ